jgi:hypothetical protein
MLSSRGLRFRSPLIEGGNSSPPFSFARWMKSFLTLGILNREEKRIEKEGQVRIGGLGIKEEEPKRKGERRRGKKGGKKKSQRIRGKTAVFRVRISLPHVRSEYRRHQIWWDGLREPFSPTMHCPVPGHLMSVPVSGHQMIVPGLDLMP